MALSLKRALPTGGVNLVDAPTALKENECQWAKNVWPKQPGVISPRGSLEFLWGANLGLSLNLVTIYNAMLFGKFIPQRTLAPSAADRAFVVDVAGTLKIVTGAHTSSLIVDPIRLQTITGVVGRGCFVDIGFGAILFLDGVGPGWVISDGTLDFRFWEENALDDAMDQAPAIGISPWGMLQTWEDGSDFITTPGDPTVGPFGRGGLPPGWRPRIAVMCRERLVYFNLADTHRDAMVWSDKNNPAVLDVGFAHDRWWAWTTGMLDADGPYTRLGGDNADITAALAIATSNEQNLVEQSILVWKRDRVFLVQGEPGQTHEFGTAPDGTLSIKELSVRAGCVGQSACCNTPYGVFWVGPDDVWFMAIGTLPIRVGTKISPRLRAQAASDGWKIQCVYAAGRLIVTLASGGSGAGDASLDEQWWLDLRRGPPQGWQDAVWFGPQNFTTTVTNYTTSGLQFLLKDDAEDAVVALGAAVRLSGVYTTWAHACSLDGDSGVDSLLEVAKPYPWVPSGEFQIGAIIDPVKYADNTPASLLIGTPRDFPFRSIPWASSDENFHKRYSAGASSVAPYLTGAAPPSFGGASVTDNNIVWEALAVSIATPRQLESNSVLIDIISREETLGDPAIQKNFDGVEIAHDLNQPMVVDLISLGSRRDSNLGRQSFGASSSSRQQAAGLSRVNQSLLTSSALGTRFLPAVADGGRNPGFSHAFRLQTKSYIVLERPMSFTFQIDSGSAFGRFACAVPAGYYGDVDALIAALNTAISTSLDNLFPVRDFNLVFGVEVDLLESPFVYAWFDGTELTSLGSLDAAIPLMHRESPTTTVGGFTFPAGPYPPTAPEIEGAPGLAGTDRYEDTTYLMSLLGFMIGPTMAHDKRGVYMTSGYSFALEPNAVFANTAAQKARAYPRFNIYDLNMRFRTFAKRPT